MHSSIEKLQKFFKLEKERGYDNRAVVGGLDKIIPAWDREAHGNQIEEGVIQTVIDRLKEYPSLDLAGRTTVLDQLIEDLQKVPTTPPAPTAPRPQSAPRPAAPRPEPVQRTEPVQRAEPPHRPEPVQRPAAAPVRSEPAPRQAVQSRPASTAAASTSRRAQPQEEPRSPAGLNAPLTVIQGIGPKHAQTLERLGLRTLEDLLYNFPRRYDDYSQLKPINRLTYGEEVTVLGTIQAIQTRAVRGGSTQLTEAVISDGTGTLRLSWFNQPWLANHYNTGGQVVVSGKLDQYLGRMVMNSPDIEPIDQEHLHTNRIVPVYPLTANITEKWLRRMMYQAVNFWALRVQDYMPTSVKSHLKLMDLGAALLQTHFPESQEMLDIARWRLAFDEIFLLQLGVLRQKRAWQSTEAHIFETSDDWLEAQLSRLPFALTGAQKNAIQDVRRDISSGKPMNRLLQGDVGSGKTVVAALAVQLVTHQNAQAAIMAPTSILAEQHFRSLQRLLTAPNENGEAPLQPEQIRLLVGDTSTADKQDIRDGLADGSIKLVIGTHALIEAPILFKDLELVVVDEQHRFGVAQRSALRSKGTNPHLLVMTATPIPRSLALTVYGDLDLTVMDEMPAGRQPIETHVLRPLERERAYTLIRAQVTEGRQAFIIYPLVEQGEKEETLAAVESHARLQKEIFPNLKLGLLHGRMKPDEKDEVMARFRDGETQILVSTSVVEVGVDVPNATVMMIEGANRFGLAQLHQFRGRVGRGQQQSYCLLIADGEDAVENERLAVMAETNDGFVLAERDLQQRGPGEFLGTRQAGFNELKMANLTDEHIIEKARQQALSIFQEDPDMTAQANQLLVIKLNQFWGGPKGDIS